MTCHVCRGAAAATPPAITTGGRSGDPGIGRDLRAETGGRGRDRAGSSLTPGPAGSGVRARRESRLRNEIKGTLLGRGRGPAVTGRGVQRDETTGEGTVRGGLATGRGDQTTEATGTEEASGMMTGGNGTR